MKRKLTYKSLNFLSLLSALACAWLLVGPVVGMLVGKYPHGSEWGRWIGTVFGLLILTVVLYVLWDIGTRLVRIEEAQELILREIRKGRDEHKG
jgi:hypothetical protein